MAEKLDIDSLTGLRGAAAIYIVIYHYFIGLTMTNPATTFLAHGYLAVDLFFMLSGFVMALNYADMFSAGPTLRAYMNFLGRRIARVYPLYLLVTVCGFLLLLVGWDTWDDRRSVWIGLIANILMVQAWGVGSSLDGPAWSISAEWAAYLIFPLLLMPTVFCKPGAAKWTFGLCLALIGLLCVVPPAMKGGTGALGTLDFHESNWGLPVCRCLLEFSLGLLAFRLGSTRSGKVLTRAGWPVLILCGISVLLLCIPRSDLLFVVVVPLSLVALSNGSKVPQRVLSSSPFMVLGRYSYSIYLIHDLFHGRLAWVHHQAALHGLKHAQSYAAVTGAIATCLFSWLAFKFVEAPGRKLLRRAFERQNAEILAKV